MALLEICCYSMECALTAQQNGADKYEYCAAPKEGGLTPYRKMNPSASG
ncbi:copper homeostasis protein CutC [Escherichia coli]